MFTMLGQCNACIFPTGICRLYTFDFLFSSAGKILLYISVVVFAISYLAELKMLSTTFILFCLSCVIISFHESNGIYFRATVLSAIWFVQFIAYAQKHFNPDFNSHQWRIQYTVQIISAVYFLAAVAKLRISGIGWVNAGPLFSLQVIKNFSLSFYNSGEVSVMERGWLIANTLLHNKLITKIFLSASLFLELFCFLAAFNYRLKIIFGTGLLLMHVGIALIMGIGVSVIAFPMTIFFINPLWIVYHLVERTKKSLPCFV